MEYLFALNGDWIAFRMDRYVFDPESNWVGWLPYDDPDVFSPEGVFVGRIGPGGRLYVPRRVDRRIPSAPPRPKRPPRPPRPPHQPPIAGPPGGSEVTLTRAI